MSMTPGYRLISIDASRVDEMAEVTSWGFIEEIKPEDRPDFAGMVPFGRARATEIQDAALGDVGTLAGVAAAYDFRMRVPGGALVPVAGLTMVSVHTAHRRRGLLRAMMADHLADARSRGEVASALYAAESEIYQRFGYGLAARQVDVRMARGATLRDVPGSADLKVRIERLSRDRHSAVIARVQQDLDRPGTMTLDHAEALRARFGDPTPEHARGEKLRIVVVERADGTPVGYAMFRRKGTWSPEGIPDGLLLTREFAATTPAAAHRLWSVLLDVDLVSTVEAEPLAIDDPLLWLLTDMRAAKPRLHDNIWLRIVDVPAALTAREYLCPVDAVIQVVDPLFPDNAGPWRVTSRSGTGHVESAPGAEPDVVLSVQELGAAYLGGVSLTSLAAAGLIEERRPGAVRALAAAFESTSAPVSNLHF
ncbi:GNAT family N-acetyltransferase [Demequina sp.]|uniref:GNAT family N-acetyltransferase n=1 Tax=Demequina sp. TaxID=2050685 RepID=UPI0025D21487|nr:GNAT family N-acetyltransferase [Demequina sp.]